MTNHHSMQHSYSMHSLLASASMLLLMLMLPQIAAGLQCLDADGQPLDWFAMLKQPNGTEYAYVSSRKPNTWTQPSPADLKFSGPLYQTLTQVLPVSAPVTDVLAGYNDEPPTGDARDSSLYGHMKGIVALTAGTNGFWMIHSAPKFLNFSYSTFSYPHSAIMYGQSFLCITVNSSNAAEAIGNQLFTSHPNLYMLKVSTTAKSKWPIWEDLASQKQPPVHLMNTSVEILTSAGLSVLHVAKSRHLKMDLYADLLTSQIDSSIQVESWRHGTNLLNSSCGTRYNVTTVLDVRIAELKDFPSTRDHSKWCTGAGSKPYVCIGDMNRAKSQFKRGGGIACLSLPGLHRLFKAAVISEDSCDSTTSDLQLERKLLDLFKQMIISILCAVAGTVVVILLITWFTVKKYRRYQHI